MQYLAIVLLILGIILILDSITNFGLFSSELSVKYLGKKGDKYFGIFVGIVLILSSIYLFIFHNE